MYDGRYYDWKLTASEGTTRLRTEMAPVGAEAVFATISSSYDSASPDVRAAVDSGSVTGWSVESGIVDAPARSYRQ